MLTSESDGGCEREGAGELGLEFFLLVIGQD